MNPTEDNNLVVAVLPRPESMRHYNVNDLGLLPLAFAQLFDLFLEPENVTVVVDHQFAVLDIRRDSESLGYFPMRTICQTLGIPIGELIYHGEYNTEQLGEMANEQPIWILPLFGEAVEQC